MSTQNTRETNAQKTAQKIVIQRTRGLGDSVVLNPKSQCGFLGVSINHRYFSRKTMETFFAWSSFHFSQFVILLMDDPDQFNYQVFRGIDSDAALAKARKLSDDRKRGYEKSLRKLGIDNIGVVQFRDFCFDSTYQKHYQRIETERYQNAEFHRSLDSLMRIGIGEKIVEHASLRKWSNEERQTHESTLLNYIVQEMAAIVHWSERGFPVEVDPTEEFRTKTELYEGKFPNLAKDLAISERGHLFAHPEGNPKWTY